MRPFDAYAKYEALKLHFKRDDYDYFKYHGKTRVSYSSFEGRNDKIFFQMMAKKYSTEDVFINFVVSNFLVNESVWPKYLVTPEAAGIYAEREKRMQALSYTYEQELDSLFQWCSDNGKEPNDLLKVPSDSEPILLKMFQQNLVTVETLIIMDMILKFLEKWDRKLSVSDTIIWPKVYRKILKYRPFLSIDTEKFEKITKLCLTKAYI